MSKQYKFPKKLFVYYDEDAKCLLCYGTARECVDIDEDCIVGVYELKETGTLKVDVDVVQAPA